MHILKKTTAFISALIITLTMAACSGGQGGGSAATGADVLRVGMECAYAPFNWTQTDNSNGAVAIEGGGYASGYDVEIAKVIAAALGRELVIVKTEWEGLVPGVTSGKLDLIIAGMSPTDDRRETIDFSDYYYTSDIVVVVKKDSPYAGAVSISDFSGAKITGQISTLHYEFINQMQGVDKQAAMKDFGTMIAAVSSGKIDGYVSERPGAMSAVLSNPDLTYVHFDGDNGFELSMDEISISVGLKKENPLLDKINEAITGISDSDRQKFMEDAIRNQPAA